MTVEAASGRANAMNPMRRAKTPGIRIKKTPKAPAEQTGRHRNRRMREEGFFQLKLWKSRRN
jgi:hypothetical protein